MKKRVFALLCAGVLAVSAVTGCGNKAGASDTAASVTQGSTAAGTDSTTTETEDAKAGDSTALETTAVEEAAAALEQAATEEAPGIDISVMKPWVNSNIKGVVTDDVTADIKDDFYLAVNHDWLRDTTRS